MATRKTLTERSTLYTGQRGSVVITRLAPGYMLMTLYGFNDGELGPSYYAEMEAEMDAAGFLVLFMDSREQSGISTAERDRTAKWTEKHQRGKYRAGHLLFRSNLLKMALAVVRMMTGHALHGYTNVEEFEAAIRAGVPSFSHLPSFTHHIPAASGARS